jgi:hypothetical protein
MSPFATRRFALDLARLLVLDRVECHDSIINTVRLFSRRL